MYDMTKKVVILNNFSSPYISEAIIILKDYDARMESRIIIEAEKIVSDYMEHNVKTVNKKNGQTPYKPVRRKKHPSVVVLSVCGIIIAYAVYRLFF